MIRRPWNVRPDGSGSTLSPAFHIADFRLRSGDGTVMEFYEITSNELQFDYEDGDWETLE